MTAGAGSAKQESPGPIACDLVVEHALVLALDDAETIVADGAVAVAGDRIAALGPSVEIARDFQGRETIDARGGILLPGLVNVHNHTPLMITRGMVEDLGHAPAYTPGIPQGPALAFEEVLALSRLGAYELLRAGSTTVVDYYLHPKALAEAMVEVGLRGVVGGRILDADMAAVARGGKRRHDPAIGRATLDEAMDLAETYADHPDARIRCELAPHAPDTCSAALLREVRDLAESAEGCVHTHLAQSRGEVEWVRARDGVSPVELLDECGLLDERLVAAHCIFLDPSGVARAGASGLTVAHAPIGNLRAGDIAPVLDLEAAGARVALCTDTMSGDLFEAMRTAIAAARIHAGEAGSIERVDLDARKALGWATRAGAEALGLGDLVGSIEAGKKADLVLLDAGAPNLAPIVDGYGIVVHSGSGHDVDTVVVDGRVLLRAGRPVGFDGDRIVADAQAVAERQWRLHGTRPVVFSPSWRAATSLAGAPSSPASRAW